MIELKSFANATPEELATPHLKPGNKIEVKVELDEPPAAGRKLIDTARRLQVERIQLAPGVKAPGACGEINEAGQRVEYVEYSPLTGEVARKGRYMHLFTGGKYYPMDPRPEEVDIRDIAHSLATKARYNGHTTFPYPVGQHSRYTALYRVEGFNAPVYRLERLLHDGSEAYNGDLIRPLKYDPDFRAPFGRVEALNEQAIALRFNLPYPMLPHHKIADEAVTAAEVEQIVKQRADVNFDGKLHDDRVVADIIIKEEDWRSVESRFLKLFAKLEADRFMNESEEYWSSEQYQRTLLQVCA
jgi:hypothetical protein